jgi:hypothetical protein
VHKKGNISGGSKPGCCPEPMEKKTSCEKSIKSRLQLFNGSKVKSLPKFYKGICFQRSTLSLPISNKVL